MVTRSRRINRINRFNRIKGQAKQKSAGHDQGVKSLVSWFEMRSLFFSFGSMCFVVSALSVLSMTAFSVELSPLPQSPKSNIADGGKQVLPCDKIQTAFNEYAELARANELAYAEFMGEVTSVLYDWHDNLVPLEDKSEPIEQGTFEPIVQGADQMDEIVMLFYDNSELLEQRRKQIFQSLQNCL